MVTHRRQFALGLHRHAGLDEDQIGLGLVMNARFGQRDAGIEAKIEQVESDLSHAADYPSR